MALDATPGGASANSYATATEFDNYNDTRFPQFTISASGTLSADDVKEALLIQATRVLDLSLSGAKKLVFDGQNQPSYYRIGPRWSGAPATTTQALAWPRTGMLNRNGVAIASNVLPQELKNAVCELAGQMAAGDRALDNTVAASGLKSLSVGSISLSFKDAIDFIKLIPDMVYALLVPSWILEETTDGAMSAAFDVL